MTFSPGKFYFPVILRLLSAALLVNGCTYCLRAENTSIVTESAADLAWKDLKHANETPPEPLKQLPDHMYTQQELLDYYIMVASRAGEVADQARQFYIKYPDHARAAEAKDIYFDMLHTSVESNTTNRIAELEAATAERLQDTKLDEAARFQLSLHLLRSAVSGREHESNEAMRSELEKRARQLIKNYPAHPDGVNFLINMARASGPEKSAALAQEILTCTSDAKTKTECQGLINRTAALGQPLNLKLPLEGIRMLDLEQVRGKVVCLFFWDANSKFSPKAIWAVNELYKTYHAQGLEIWGLNFDEKPEDAAALLKDNNIEWPQYFDLPAGGKIRQQFGLYALPTVWLVDKKGVLRELKAERGPEPIIQKLLAEQGLVGQ